MIKFLFSFLIIFNASAGVVQTNGAGTLLLSGTLDQANQKSILKELDSTKKVILNDVGSGELEIYLAIAKKMMAKKVDVEIQNACIATCVYLFLAGKNKTLNNGFLGVTENTNYYVKNWDKVKEQFENPDKNAKKEDLLKELKRVAAMENRILAPLKIKPEMFERLPIINNSRGENAYSFVIYKPETLKKYNVQVFGTIKIDSIHFKNDLMKNNNLYIIE